MGSDSGGPRVPDCRRGEDRSTRARLGLTVLSGRNHLANFVDKETGLDGPFPRLPDRTRPSSRASLCLVLHHPANRLLWI